MDRLLLWHGLEHFAHVCFPSKFEDDPSIRIDPRQCVDRTDESQPHYTFLLAVLLLQLALVELESTEIRIQLRGAEEAHPGSHPKRESYHLDLRWLPGLATVKNDCANHSEAAIVISSFP